jgi:O-antigen/teichoic acid export membrane protein
MDPGTLQQKLYHGSLAGMARIALAIPVYLVLTPLVLRALGPEQFGIWSFSTIIVSLMNLTDFGLKNSLIYQVARNTDRPEEVRQSFSATIWIYLAISAVLVVGTALWGQEAIPLLLNVPDRLRDEVIFVLWVTVAGFVWRLLALPYQAVVEGYQELSGSQLVFLAWLIVHFLGSLAALAVSPTVYGLGWAGLVGNVFIFAAFFRTVRRRFPHVVPQLRGVFGKRIGRMAGFALAIQIASVCIVIREPLYKILIARSFDLASVATFEITYKLCTQLMSVIATPLLGVFGAAALLAVRQEALSDVLRPLVGWTLGALLPAAMGMALFAQPLMQRWLGRDDVAVGTLLPAMCVAFAVYYSTEALYKAIEGSGRAWYGATIQLVVLTAQIGSFWFFSSSHAQAAAWSLLIGYALFSLSNLFMFRVCFPGVRLLTRSQWIQLTFPSCVSAAALSVAPDAVQPFLFGGYLLLHLWALVASGLVDAGVIRNGLMRKRVRTGRADMIVSRGMK